ncbi:MAG: transcriptional repressor [Dysgonamonadaceae bacterium]|jgi:Fur family ferric uptake transcriptional regulator|nr:transcriptional repressor [Dysgonamonadaceae bacterium]
MDKDKIKDIVKQKFTEYLSAKRCRKTPERYAILDSIYSHSGHFSMDALYEYLNTYHFRVSRATIYNTIQLLIDCKLVIKHQLGNNSSYYEKAYNNDLHHHLVCTHCGNIRDYKSNELEIPVLNKKIKQFIPSFYKLYIFGTCKKCNTALKKETAKSLEKTKKK